MGQRPAGNRTIVTGTPAEFAHTALFLASGEAPFINAETVAVDADRSAQDHD